MKKNINKYLQAKILNLHQSTYKSNRTAKSSQQLCLWLLLKKTKTQKNTTRLNQLRGLKDKIYYKDREQRLKDQEPQKSGKVELVSKWPKSPILKIFWLANLTQTSCNKTSQNQFKSAKHQSGSALKQLKSTNKPSYTKASKKWKKTKKLKMESTKKTKIQISIFTNSNKYSNNIFLPGRWRLRCRKTGRLRSGRAGRPCWRRNLESLKRLTL